LVASGEENTIMAITAEITARREAEEALREKEARYRHLFDNAEVGMFRTRLDGSEILDFNEKYLEIFERTREEVQGGPATIHWADLSERAEMVRRLEAEGRVTDMECSMLTATGAVRRCLTSVRLYREQGVLEGSILDITDWKEAEERLRKLSDQVPGVIYEYRLYADGRSCFPYSSSGIQDIYEVTPEEVREDATPVFGRIHPDDLDATAAAIFESARTLELFHWEFRVVLPRQGLRWRLCDAAPSRMPDGGTLWYGIISDITERKLAEAERVRLQAQLQQVQKLESLGSLAGGVAHDMNNVLGAILGLATVNLKSHPEGSPTHQAFSTIAKAATRGGEMVRRLLTFARQSPVEDHETDLNGIITEAVKLLERTTLAQVRLELDLEPGLRLIRGDAGALSHVFLNLCVNAVDAMDGRGTLTLRTRNVDPEWIEATVEDSGVGMSQAVLAQAFDPFFTTKMQGKGTGLGLSIVHTTVTAHRGLIEIQSEPGRGSQVRMRFPTVPAEVHTPEPTREASGRPSQRALHVLLVDDDQLIQCSLNLMLDFLGHRATSFDSGEEALAGLEGGLQPDVVILDMNMPGLGGAGTLPRLRTLRPQVPILVATGRVNQATLNLVGAQPGVTLLSKPFTLEELQQRLEQVAPRVNGA
jgi:PAS domain S-box-containing protein